MKKFYDKMFIALKEHIEKDKETNSVVLTNWKYKWQTILEVSRKDIWYIDCVFWRRSRDYNIQSNHSQVSLFSFYRNFYDNNFWEFIQSFKDWLNNKTFSLKIKRNWVIKNYTFKVANLIHWSWMWVSYFEWLSIDSRIWWWYAVTFKWVALLNHELNKSFYFNELDYKTFKELEEWSKKIYFDYDKIEEEISIEDIPF